MALSELELHRIFSLEKGTVSLIAWEAERRTARYNDQVLTNILRINRRRSGEAQWGVYIFKRAARPFYYVIMLVIKMCGDSVEGKGSR